jgi:hypothetical protein
MHPAAPTAKGLKRTRPSGPSTPAPPTSTGEPSSQGAAQGGSS